MESPGLCDLDPLSDTPCELLGTGILDWSSVEYSDFSQYGLAQRIETVRGEQCSVETLDYVDYDHTALVDHTLLRAGLVSENGGGGDGSGTAYECDVTSSKVAPVRQEVSYQRDPATLEVLRVHLQEGTDAEELLVEYGYTFGQIDSVTQTAINPGGALGTTSPTRVWTRQYDGTGIFVEAEINPLGHQTTHWWHPDLGVNIQTTGPTGVRTDKMFDAFGRGRSVQLFGNDALPAAPAMTVDYLRVLPDQGEQLLPSPMLLRETSPEGSTTVAEYDEHGELRRSEWDVDAVTRVFSTRRIQRHLDRTQVFESLPVAVGASPELESLTELDPHGRILSVDPASADVGPTTYVYAGLETTVQSPVGDAVTYRSNGAGLLESVIDESNVRTCYHYGSLSRLRDVVVNPEAGYCDGTIPTDSLESTSTHFEYSQLGYPVLRDVPSSGIETTEFNAFGEPWRITTAAGSTSVVRDEVGRMLHRYDSDGQNAHFAWDVGELDAPPCTLGALCSSTSSDGVVREYAYDEVGRMDSVRTTIDAVSFRSGYRYDEFGRVGQVWHDGAPTVEHEYDAVGAFTAVSITNGPELWRASQRDETGPVIGAVYGNGAQFARTIEEGLLRETRLDAPNMTPAFPGAEGTTITIDSLALTYDAAGRIESREIPHLGLVEVFAYDHDRLAGAAMSRSGESLGAWSQTYYPTGAVDNHSEVGDFTYADAAHPLGVTQAGTVSYAYDARGRQASRDGDTFTWNVRGRLRSVSGDDDVTYAYDAQDTRVRKVESTPDGIETTYYGGGEELKIVGDVETRTIYVNGPEGPVAALKSEDGFTSTQVLYLHNNELGSSSVVTDAAGVVVQRQDFDAFGRSRPLLWDEADGLPSLPADVDVGFTGHRREESYGLIDMGGRHFDPHIARFASPDPFVADPLRAVGYDPFAYVLNRPMRFTDPSGYLPKNDFEYDYADMDAHVDSFVVFGDVPEQQRSRGAGGTAREVDYNYGLLSSAEETVDADLQLELDALTVDDSFGTDEWANVWAERYLPEPAPANPDRLSLPRLPEYDVPNFVRSAYPLVSLGNGNGAIELVEDVVNLPSEVGLGYDEVSQGVVRVANGDTLNGVDEIAHGAGRWGHALLTVLSAREVAGAARGAVRRALTGQVGPQRALPPAPSGSSGRAIPLGPSNGGQSSITRFVEGPTITSHGRVVGTGTVDLQPTLTRIRTGQSFPHRNDGSIFGNREGLLPTQPRGYYREYVHPTPGVRGPGPQRVVQGQGGELFYTPDHYASFIRLN